MNMVRCSASMIALAVCISATASAWAQQVIVVPSGTTDTTPKTVGGTDQVTVEAGGTLSTTSNPTINWSSASTNLRITNSGTIRSTAAGGRAINASGANNARNATITNNAGGVIQSEDDALRINVAATSGIIRVENRGIIRTTNGGQAIDFDAITGGAGIIINNYAGGEIRSFGQDAIRPGGNATVTNSGLIYSDGAPNNNFDGIDWQARTGRVINNSGGVISGLRHGITADNGVDVTNSGTIVGRNGSGVGSDSIGTVVNFGTITGSWDGVSLNGDGDGVDIDGAGSVTNAGTIQGLSAAGVDSGGRANSAQGVAMGGGSIFNATGGLIHGGAQGVLINRDTNPGGAADTATTIINESGATIRGGSGPGILFVGNFNDTITNSGLIAGGNGVAVDMGGGDDTFTLFPTGSLTGIVDGGAGTDGLILTSIGVVDGTFNAAGFVNFETLTITNGNWQQVGVASFSGGTTINGGTSLTGSTDTFAGRYNIFGALVFDQATDGAFTGQIIGSTNLNKRGTGTITLGNQAGFNGALTIFAGAVRLNGAMPAAVTVRSGGTLTGNFSVGSVQLLAGSVLTPGDNGLTAVTIAGNFAHNTGATINFQTSSTGASDRINVSGTASLSGTLAVTRDSGNYVIGTRYVVVQTGAGISGTMTLSQPTGLGTEFRQLVSNNAAILEVVRSASGLRDIAQGSTQQGVAQSLSGLGAGNGVYDAITRLTTDAATRDALNLLAGEIHSTLRQGAVRDTHAVDSALLSRAASLYTGSGFWVRYLSRDGHDDAEGSASATDHSGSGVIGGMDARIGENTRIGLGGGYTKSRVRVPQVAQNGEFESIHAFGYAGTKVAGFTLRAGGGYSWISNDVQRDVVFPGVSDRTQTSYDARVIHGIVEVGRPVELFGATVEPFANYSTYSIQSDGFAETRLGTPPNIPGPAALSGTERTDRYSLSNLGVRGDWALMPNLVLRARVAWQHVFDDTGLPATVSFLSSTPFEVRGNGLASDTAATDAELTWRANDQITVSVGYAAILGSRNKDGVASATVSIGF